MKKVKYVLLAILSVFIFAFASCKDDVASSTPQSSSSPKQSSSKSNYYDATSYDVIFNSIVADDKLSVLIEVTPKWNIENLKIETCFIFSLTNTDKHVVEYANAPKDKTISFRVYLSEPLIESGKKIDIYQYDIVGGQYQADTDSFHGTAFYSEGVLKITQDDAIIEAIISEDKQSILFSITPNYNVLDLKLYVRFNIAENISVEADKVKLGYSPATKLINYRVFLPHSFIEQGFEIDGFQIQAMGDYLIPIESTEE